MKMATAAQRELRITGKGGLLSRSLTNVHAVTALRMASCFCFAVINMHSPERQLLSKPTGASFFSSCGAFEFYSNVTDTDFSLRGVVSGPMETTRTSHGPASQTDIILFQAWAYVLKDAARLTAFEWLVKLDVDTVALPCRLWPILQKHDARRPLLFANGWDPISCSVGQASPCAVHGPMIVMSSSAGRLLARTLERFRVHIWNDEAKKDEYSDDLTLATLATVAGCTIVPERGLLAEFFPGRSIPDCSSDHVAFHPMKTPMKHRQCLRHAMTQVGCPSAIAVVGTRLG